MPLGKLISVLLSAVFLLSSASTAANIDVDILNFALNLEYLEATFYSFVAKGRGLRSADRGYGPPTIGSAAGFRGRLSPQARLIASRIAIDELSHVKFLRRALGAAAVPAPEIDVGAMFAKAADAAFGATLSPPFSPYASDVVFYHGAFIFEDVGVTAYKGAARFITNKDYLEAAAGILGTEAYHAGLIRSLLFQVSDQFVFPYGAQVSTVVAAISNLRKSVSGKDDDQGIIVNSSIVIAPADANAIAYSRTTSQVLSIVYLGGTGSGGFFPKGLNGNIK